MNNLVTKAGVAAVGSVLLSVLVPISEAQAFNLTPTKTGSIAYDSKNNVFLKLDLENSKDPRFAGINDTGAVEAGEFILGEVRGFAEYDLSSIFSMDTDKFRSYFNEDLPLSSPDQKAFFITFDLFLKAGSGTAGSGGPGDNSSIVVNSSGDFVGFGPTYTFDGTVNIAWYIATALDPLNLNFNPQPAANFNPLASILVSDLEEGDKISLNVSQIVRDAYFKNARGQSTNPFLGITFTANLPNIGVCGPQAGNNGRTECEGVTFNNFDLVPTPAAILPTLLGLASAAFRKKRNEINGVAEEAEL